MTASNIKLRKRILKGLELTYKQLIKNKIEKNLELVISDDGKVVHVDPKTFRKNNRL